MTWSSLNRRIEGCQQCDRLVEYCQGVAQKKRRAYQDETYWGRPVPNMGQSRVGMLIVGLAPGAHGANRTGRMFTGDRSGEWLVRALHKAGFANQADSINRKDGLKLVDCAITAICHCAPPGNKPTKDELIQCQPFLQQTIELCRPNVFLALGGLAWKAMLNWAVDVDLLETVRPLPKFGHAAEVALVGGSWLLGSYHPSQQNTFTGRLTEPMLDQVFVQARKRIRQSRKT